VGVDRGSFYKMKMGLKDIPESTSVSLQDAESDDAFKTAPIPHNLQDAFKENSRTDEAYERRSQYGYVQRRAPFNRKVAHRPEPQAYAALDLGTNNCRLLIAIPAYKGFRVIDAFSRIVRLGEGLSQTGYLSEEAIKRTIEALKVCANKINQRRAIRVRLVATEACRAAHNKTDFLNRVKKQTGLELEIVDQRTEAMLAADGCVSLLAPEAHSAILFDIGGGSTEIVCLERNDLSRSLRDQIKAWVSIPIGVVSLSETCASSATKCDHFESMVQVFSDQLQPFIRDVGDASFKSGFHLLGTSGTVTTLAAIHLGLPRYERRYVDGIWLQDAQVNDVIESLLSMSREEKSAHKCIGEDRSDLMLAGCAILEAIRRAFPSQRLRIADRGLREGILMNMMRDDGMWRDH
jgi:exopolyphosphatase/guanosine-5'-triphosphate,3'-diphosphate pyrophosphatase